MRRRGIFVWSLFWQLQVLAFWAVRRQRYYLKVRTRKAVWNWIVCYILGKMHWHAVDLKSHGKRWLSSESLDLDPSSQSWLCHPLKSCKFFVFIMPLAEFHMSVFCYVKNNFCLLEHSSHGLHLMASCSYTGRDGEQPISVQPLQTMHKFIDP